MADPMFAPDVEEIRQRRALAKALIERGISTDGSTQMVGGHAIPNSPFNGIANILSGVRGRKMEKQTDTEEAKMKEAMVAALREEDEKKDRSVERLLSSTNDYDEYGVIQNGQPLPTKRDYKKSDRNSGTTDPYFKDVPTSNGILRWNARTGEYALATDAKGNPYMPPAIDAAAQGAVAGAKARGAVVGENAGQTDLKFIRAEDNADNLKEIKKLLPQATGSGLGQVRDAVAGFFGGSTDGAEAAGGLDILAAKMTMQVPRLEGPQSDRDTQLYKEAAGQFANRGLPSGVRMAALATMERINNEYLPGGAKHTARTEGAAAAPATGQPAGVDPELWKHMTLDERALWK